MLKLPVTVDEFASRLLDWYRRQARDLPWRSDPTPYRVWLSEVMLQQTRVETALPYFERFLRAYPTLEDLAAADERQALSLWAGLGYYSRARNLLAAARLILRRHGGLFPDNVEDARRLPGVGRYTAGAVLSIALGKAAPILDGNIRRLLCRYLRLDSDPAAVERELWKLLEGVVHHPAVEPRVSDFNQALMEIGALICTPRRPSCPACPLRSSCLARLAGLESELPRARPRRPSKSLEFVAAIVVRHGRYLMQRSSEEPFPKDFWEFPRVPGKPRLGLAAEFRARHGIELAPGEPVRPVRHQITHHKLIFHPLPCVLRGAPPGQAWTWVAIDQPDFPVATYAKKIHRRLAARPPDSSNVADCLEPDSDIILE